MEQPVAVQVPGGPRLEAMAAAPAAPVGGLLVCHPHPLYGGDMDNPVVIRAVEVAQAAGLATLRFNFRGVGASQGVHDRGPGERDDVAAALAALAGLVPAGRPCGLAGYSFGAWVSAQVAMAVAPSPVAALALIAPPLGMLDWGFAKPVPHLLLVAGSRDTYCPLDALQQIAERLPGAERVVIDGADHFFFGKLFPLGTALEAWIRRWSGGT
jgi:alpha/beta superfamily hydrolase